MLDDHIWASQSPDAFGGLARTNVTSHDQLVLRVIANREGYRPHEPRKPLSRRSQKSALWRPPVMIISFTAPVAS